MIDVIFNKTDKYKKIKKILKNTQEEFCERFWNFDSLYSWVVMIPWGLGFIYLSLYHERFLYKYAGITVGIHLILLGLRKGTMNPIKYWNKVEDLQERRRKRVHKV